MALPLSACNSTPFCEILGSHDVFWHESGPITYCDCHGGCVKGLARGKSVLGCMLAGAPLMCACTRSPRRSTWTASTASHRGLTASRGAALAPQMGL